MKVDAQLEALRILVAAGMIHPSGQQQWTEQTLRDAIGFWLNLAGRIQVEMQQNVPVEPPAPSS